jgi:hypothetical protein
MRSISKVCFLVIMEIQFIIVNIKTANSSSCESVSIRGNCVFYELLRPGDLDL